MVGGFVPEGMRRTAIAASMGIERLPHAKASPRRILDAGRIPLNREQPVFVDFAATALYPPVSYVPQALGIGAGNALNLPPLLLRRRS
jgi:hypothetical protein